MALHRLGNLASRIEHARRLALQRLIETRSPDGTWEGSFDVSVFESAVFIVMLRTTGLIERPEWAYEEERLVRHMVLQVNRDGGFYKYPGSPSCRSLTRLASLALRMASGDIYPTNRPNRSSLCHRSISDDLLLKMRQVLEGSEAFLQGDQSRTWLSFEMFPASIAKILCAYVDPREPHIPFSGLAPEFCGLVGRSSLFIGICRQVNFMLRKALPGISILSRAIGQRRPTSRALWSVLKILKPFQAVRSTAVDDLVRRLLSSQNDSGSWSVSPFYTMLNVMALSEAGLPSDHPAIERALSFLRECVTFTREGTAFFRFLRTDVWDTSLALGTILRNLDAVTEDFQILPAIEFLLSSQAKNGGFPMASSVNSDPDVDSTALVLRVLVQASRASGGVTAARISPALGRGLAFLLGRQNRQGGYSAFDRSICRSGKRGSHGLFLQGLFDAPTADLTARVLFALAEVGMKADDEPVERGLHFLLQNQCRNGAWWSRWWAGYIPGTDFALDTIGRLGYRYGPNPCARNEVAFRIHQAMLKGIRFLLLHQNADGGWGETVWSDFDIRHAGTGKSRPLHTASALHELLCCGYPVNSTSVEKGYEFLLASMNHEGLWHDHQVNFTMIPRIQYYAYPFLNYILPINALNAFLNAADTLPKCGGRLS